MPPGPAGKPLSGWVVQRLFRSVATPGALLLVSGCFGNVTVDRTTTGSGGATTAAAASSSGGAGGDTSTGGGDTSTGGGAPRCIAAGFAAGGTYGAVPGLTVSAQIALTLSDMDGDGDLDLTQCFDLGYGAVRILLNRGDGTFAAKVDHDSMGTEPNGMAVGDLDGDGRPDVFVTSDYLGASSFLVRQNQGDGTLGDQLFLSEGPFKPVVGDLNGDKKPEVVGIVGGSFVRVQSNLTLEAFGEIIGTAVDYQVPVTGAVTLGDLNGDGALDLVGMDTSGGAADDGIVRVLLNNGDGTLAAAGSYPAKGVGVKVADLNGDGKPDVVTDGVSVLLNNGDGTLAPAITHAFYGDASYYRPSELAVGDLNGDKLLDLAFVDTSDHTVKVLLNAGDGTFLTTEFDYPPERKAMQVVMGDLNGDKKPDLAIANGDGTVTVLFNETCAL